MATVPNLSSSEGRTKYKADGIWFDGIHGYWVAADVGGVALCCNHGAVRHNVHGYVCWNRNRAVVNIGGTSGIADCCFVACILKGHKRFNCAVHYKQFPTDTHKHTHAPSAETKQSVTFHRPAPSSLSLPLTPMARCITSCCDYYLLCFNFFTVAVPSGLAHFIFEVTGSQTHNTRYNFSRQVISISERSLLENKRSQQCRSRPRRDSNPQSVHVNCCRPTPYNTQSLGSSSNTNNDGIKKVPMWKGFLTAWNRILIEKLMGSQLVEKFEVSMEQEGSLPHSQQSSTCPNPEPRQSSPWPHIPNQFLLHSCILSPIGLCSIYSIFWNHHFCVY